MKKAIKFMLAIVLSTMILAVCVIVFEDSITNYKIDTSFWTFVFIGTYILTFVLGFASVLRKK
jgi:hypothetical protein